MTQSTPDVTGAAWTLSELTMTVSEGAAFMVFVLEVFNTDPPAPESIHTVGRFDDLFLTITAPDGVLHQRAPR